jgi:hypothetical protein
VGKLLAKCPERCFVTYVFRNASRHIAILLLVMQVKHHPFEDVSGHFGQLDDVIRGFLELTVEHLSQRAAVIPRHLAVQKEFKAFSGYEFHVSRFIILVNLHGGMMAAEDGALVLGLRLLGSVRLVSPLTYFKHHPLATFQIFEKLLVRHFVDPKNHMPSCNQEPTSRSVSHSSVT